MSVRCWFPILCAFLCAASATAQTATLLKDINTTADISYSADPWRFTEFKGGSYFFASSGPGVTGLWRTDGTAEGTKIVKNNLDGGDLTVSGGLLFFAGDDGISGSELWKSDGTPGGTVAVIDLAPGPLDGVSPNRGMVAANGAIYFVAGDFATGLTLWKSDGTEAGSIPLLDVDPFLPSSIGLLGSYGGLLYFYANDGVNGSELWRSDGTPAGTMMLRDIRPGAVGSYPRGFAELHGTVYFPADDGVSGIELWKTDGTMMGTTLVIDLSPGAADGVAAGLSIVFNGELYFGADDGDGSGFGVWKSDGSAAGTERIWSGVGPSDFAASGKLLYFVADGASEAPEVLWKTDGTTAGTTPVRDFDSIGAVGVSYAGSLFFSASPGDHGYELWKTDGTQESTTLVRDISADGGSNPNSFALLRTNPLVPGTLLFAANDGLHGMELWKSNGSEAGTVLVKDIGVAAGASNPGEFTRVVDELYFTAANDIGQRAQWKTDGTVEATVPANEVPPLPREPGYFAFDDGVHGRELWKTDGTEAGTRLIKDVNPGTAEGVSRSFEGATVGGTFYFAADDGVHGSELWKSDGTEAGTMIVHNVHPADGRGSRPRSFAVLNGTIIFNADGGQSTNELWKSDGTDAGTVRIRDLGGAFGSVRSSVVSQNLLFFMTWHQVGGYTLWRTDGTEDGTILLKPLHHPFGPTPEMIDIQGALLFSYQDYERLDILGATISTPKGTLWRSDGTLEGTVQFKAFDSVPDADYTVRQFTLFNSLVYFLVPHPSGTQDLWKSDGTEAGTVKVGDLPAPALSVSRILGSHAGSLFLDVLEGTEHPSPHHIARTQGTPATTTVDGAPFLSNLEPFIGIGSSVFFAGTTEDTGTELWALPLLPSISANGVVDAAGYQPTLAPGSLASLFGVGLSGETAAATSFPLPTTLGSAKVKVNGVDAPLLFVSPTQINFQVPYDTPLGASVSIVASLNGQQSTSQPTAVAQFAPALFVNPATGEPIVQRHADGTLINAANPAEPGDTLVIYVTGIGGLDNPPPTGAAATDTPLATATTTPTVLIGGVEATVLFAGLAPDFAGLGQVNIVLPQGLPQGNPLPLTIRFGDNESPLMELPF